MPQPLRRIVISYAREDAQHAADEVAVLLTSIGQQAAMDHECLEGGEGWQAQFRSLIQGAEHLVLMLSKAALASEACQWEWDCAREAGLQVSPVCVGGDIDTTTLPPWMDAAHQYNLDHEAQRRRFLRVLEGPANRWHVPFMTPFRNSGFVDRPGPIQEAKARLLAGASVGIVRRRML